MRWLSRLSLMFIASLVLVTLPALANGLSPPTDFTLTAISDYEVDISWVKDAGAANTLVRAKVGEYPIGVTDGYEVYFGAGESASDFGVDLDLTTVPFYYRAWSENGGEYSSSYAEGRIGGVGMTLFALIALPIGLMVLGYVFKRQGLSFGAVFGWILLAVYSYGLSTATWDLHYGIFWLGIAMAIVSAVETMGIRGQREEPEEGTSFEKVYRAQKEHQEKQDKFREMMEPPSRRRRREK